MFDTVIGGQNFGARGKIEFTLCNALFLFVPPFVAIKITYVTNLCGRVTSINIKIYTRHDEKY